MKKQIHTQLTYIVKFPIHISDLRTLNNQTFQVNVTTLPVYYYHLYSQKIFKLMNVLSNQTNPLVVHVCTTYFITNCVTYSRSLYIQIEMVLSITRKLNINSPFLY